MNDKQLKTLNEITFSDAINENNEWPLGTMRKNLKQEAINWIKN